MELNLILLDSITQDYTHMNTLSCVYSLVQMECMTLPNEAVRPANLEQIKANLFGAMK